MSRKYLQCIKDIIKCDICGGDMHRPTMLSCHHSFCRSCLEEKIELKFEGSKHKVACPREMCGKLTNIPDGRFSKLPWHYALSCLIDIFGKCDYEPECAACPGWTDKKNPEVYCNNCNDYLCRPCSVAHTETALFKEHDMTCVEKNSTSRVLRTPCWEHPLKYKDYFCKDCKVLVCTACVTADHGQHTVTHYEAFDQSCRVNLKLQKEKLSEKFHLPIDPELLAYRNRGTALMMDDLDKKNKQIKKKIKAQTQAVIKDVERQRDELLDELEKNHAMLRKPLKADFLDGESDNLLWDRWPGGLLREYPDLSARIEAVLSENADVEIPKWTMESVFVYDDFSPSESSIGSLSKSSVKDFNNKCGEEWRQSRVNKRWY